MMKQHTVILPSCHKDLSRWSLRYPACPNTSQVQSCAFSFKTYSLSPLVHISAMFACM